MPNRLSAWLKVIIAAMLAVAVLAGCAARQPDVREEYPLESVVRNGDQQSYIYRATGESVPNVVGKLTEQRQPEQISTQSDQQMFIVYPDELYNVQRDSDKPADTLIEVSNKAFVQQNYSPSFLQGYLLASIIGNLFDANRTYAGGYRGYTSRGQYKPLEEYRPPTSAEKRIVPPLTKNGAGTIIKRGNNGATTGSGGSTVPRTTTPPGGGSGKIIRSPESGGGGSGIAPRSPDMAPPRITSPPRTRPGGGRIIRRR